LSSGFSLRSPRSLRETRIYFVATPHGRPHSGQMPDVLPVRLHDKEPRAANARLTPRG